MFSTFSHTTFQSSYFCKHCLSIIIMVVLKQQYEAARSVVESTLLQQRSQQQRKQKYTRSTSLLHGLLCLLVFMAPPVHCFGNFVLPKNIFSPFTNVKETFTSTVRTNIEAQVCMWHNLVIHYAHSVGTHPNIVSLRNKTYSMRFVVRIMGRLRHHNSRYRYYNWCGIWN